MKVLFIRLSSLGDILLTFPLISFFKSRFPDSHITLLTKTAYKETVELNKDIDEILLFDKKNVKISQMRLLIKQNKYDYIFDLHKNIRSFLFSSFSGFPVSRFNKHSIRKFLLVRFKINLLKDIPGIIVRYFQSLNKFNLFDEKSFVSYLETYGILVDEKLKNVLYDKIPELKKFEKIIAFCPSARHKTKMLPQEKYIKIGKELTSSPKSAIILMGSSDEAEYCEKIVSQISDKQCFNLAGKTSIPETSAMLKQCNIIISNDTGLMHLSNLLDIPLIALFGSTVKEFGFFPIGKNAVTFEQKELKCRPCSHIGLKECPKKHFRCMNDIDEEPVIKKAIEIINKVNK